jgi:hypothetical protein
LGAHHVTKSPLQRHYRDFLQFRDPLLNENLGFLAKNHQNRSVGFRVISFLLYLIFSQIFLIPYISHFLVFLHKIDPNWNEK